MGLSHGVTTNFQATKGIVQDGLVLNIDTADKSFSTTSGKELSSGRDISLVNGAYKTKDKGGIFNFDGSNDYVTFESSGSDDFAFDSAGFSVGGWVFVNADQNLYIIGKGLNYFGIYGWAFYSLGGKPWLNRYQGSSTSEGVGPGTNGQAPYDSATQSYNDSNWHYFVATLDEAGSSGYCKAYADGELFSSKSHTSISTTTNNTQIGEIGAVTIHGIGITQFTNAPVGPVHIYNRVLTAAEVSRNFNAMRHRFGV